MNDAADNSTSEILATLTADIVAAHVSNNSVAVSDISGLIANVHAALADLSKPAAPVEEPLTPAISVRASIKPEYIVCLEDRKKLKMLKRYLMTNFKMTPAEYRAKWGLDASYPMVAPNYAQKRKDLALKIGLGRKPRTLHVEATKKPPRRPRADKAKLPTPE